MNDRSLPSELFTLGEVARAAGVARRRVTALVRSGAVTAVGGTFLSGHDAVKAVRLLRAGAAADPLSALGRPAFLVYSRAPRVTGGSLAASATLHAVVVGVLLFVATGDRKVEGTVLDPHHAAPVRLVYLPQPGPAGGGGGGGRREPRLPRAEHRGTSSLARPVGRREPVPPAPPQGERPPLAHEPLPPLVAPVVALPADRHDRSGGLEERRATADGHGPGTGLDAGEGTGSGLGAGRGPGVGPGWGGGTGGGPYRPGSGVEPPRLLREVRPEYTDEARRHNIEGEVLFEVVVLPDGTVGPVRLVRGLGYGLDERAAEAVQRWRFAPARRFGTPVEVVVEIAVEFRLR